MVELVDTMDSKLIGRNIREGSSPSKGTRDVGKMVELHTKVDIKKSVG